jgi:hypothetical protein
MSELCLELKWFKRELALGSVWGWGWVLVLPVDLEMASSTSPSNRSVPALSLQVSVTGYQVLGRAGPGAPNVWCSPGCSMPLPHAASTSGKGQLSTPTVFKVLCGHRWCVSGDCFSQGCCFSF